VLGGTTPAVSGQPEALGDGTRPRSGMEMAMDAKGNLVLFGGINLSEYRHLGDTWTWDGSAWTEQHPADAPSPRCCYAMAYDAVRGQTVLVGGCDPYDCFMDTWTWDGADWTEQHPAHPPSIFVYSPGLAYDAARGELVLTSTSYPYRQLVTWVWDGSDWILQTPKAAPPDTMDGGLSYDAGRQLVTHFGGEFDAFESYHYRDDTWVWNGRNWKRLYLRVHPQARGRSGMAFDELAGRILMFGGCCRSLGGFFGDTWSWDGFAWQRLDPANTPLARERPAMVWDTVRQQIVLFGGNDAPYYYRDFGDTWTWDGSDWTCVDGCS
jgi:hypothetical protein